MPLDSALKSTQIPEFWLLAIKNHQLEPLILQCLIHFLEHNIQYQRKLIFIPLSGNDGKAINVQLLSVEGKFVKSFEYGQAVEEVVKLELTTEESSMAESLRKVWNEILKIDITDETDFFETGAGSMDVVRLVEEVKDKAGISITNEDVFMATVFSSFIQTVVKVFHYGQEN